MLYAGPSWLAAKDEEHAGCGWMVGGRDKEEEELEEVVLYLRDAFNAAVN